MASSAGKGVRSDVVRKEAGRHRREGEGGGALVGVTLGHASMSGFHDSRVEGLGRAILV